MKTIKVQLSTCSVKDDDIGSIDINLRDSNTMQWHCWQWQTTNGNQYTKQQGSIQQCRIDSNSIACNPLYSGHSWGQSVMMMTEATFGRMNIVYLKTINHQWQQQHNHMPSDAGLMTTLRPCMWLAMPALAGIRIILIKGKNWTINQQQ